MFFFFTFQVQIPDLLILDEPLAGLGRKLQPMIFFYSAFTTSYSTKLTFGFLPVKNY
jgi:ABC-type molybdenum transport system ATPase subunit/photorepair protein PhrA